MPAITNDAQVAALTAAVRTLQSWLAIALPAMWFAAAIVVVPPGIALVMTVRSMKAWAENRAFVGTLWTNVITSSTPCSARPESGLRGAPRPRCGPSSRSERWAAASRRRPPRSAYRGNRCGMSATT